MAGQIVPFRNNQVAALAPFVVPWTQSLSNYLGQSSVDNLRQFHTNLRQIAPRVKKYLFSPARRTHSMPSAPRRSYRKRSRKSLYKKRPRAVRKVQSIRKKARKRGNVRAAKKLVLPLGGFQERRIIRLKDVMSFKAVYTGASLSGDEHLYNGVPYSTKLAQHRANPALHADPALGKCQQYIFFMNDLRNFYAQGKFVPKTGGTPASTNAWEEPPLNHDQSNQLRKIPLSRVQAGVFRHYTVIGSEMIVKLTNNEMSKYHGSTPGTPQSVVPAHKIWYAWRLVACNTGTPVDDASEIPNPVEPDTTFQALKETGKWRMGVVSASFTDKYATRTFKIPFNSKRLFGAEEGKPGATNVTGLMSSLPKPGESDESAAATCGSVRHTAYLQLIIGPQNLSDVTNREGKPSGGPDEIPVFGQPAPTYALTDVQVDITTNFYVALTNPYPIQVVSADGIAYPVPGEPPATGTTDFHNTIGPTL